TDAPAPIRQSCPSMEKPDAWPPTIESRDGTIRLIDQRRLPGRLVIMEVRTSDDLCAAIAGMAIRGAPALGVAGAMGVALAWVNGESRAAAAVRIVETRPTAVNLRS